jgi:regulator of protease activity HflC (stomatin/prohibitin superfamily)
VSIYLLAALVLAVSILVLAGVRVVQQGTVAVVTTFGRYTRVIRPGLGFLIPLVQKIQSRPSVQNRSIEMQFQAITADQANVYFRAMLLYSVKDEHEETIKAVAFKFISIEDLLTAMTRTVEAITRGFVATKRQAEILGLRSEIVAEAKTHLDDVLADWGYHLIDLQLNDITFDEVITASMAQVVATANLKAAAVNEGDALLIKKTKEAEAEGAAIRIAADAEAEAARKRGEGVRLFRTEVAQGLADASRQLRDAGSDDALVWFAMWTETVRQAAETGTGNVIFLDGSAEGMERTMRQLIAISTSKQED